MFTVYARSAHEARAFFCLTHPAHTIVRLKYEPASVGDTYLEYTIVAVVRA